MLEHRNRDDGVEHVVLKRKVFSDAEHISGIVVDNFVVDDV